MPSLAVLNTPDSLTHSWDKSITPSPGKAFSITFEATSMAVGDTFSVEISTLPSFIQSNSSVISLDDNFTIGSAVLHIDDSVAENDALGVMSEVAEFSVTDNLGNVTTESVTLSVKVRNYDGLSSQLSTLVADFGALNGNVSTMGTDLVELEEAHDSTASKVADPNSFTSLTERVQKLVEAQDSYVMDRDLLKASDSLQREMEAVALSQKNLKESFVEIREAHNALSFRFRKLAKNEATLNNAAAVVPTQDEKDALKGNMLGEPASATNPYILEDDLRLRDERTPVGHVASHEEGGTDELQHDNLLGAKGFNSHEDIDLMLDSMSSHLSTNDLVIQNHDTRVTNLESFQSTLDFDNLPLGTLFHKTTVEESSRLLDEDTFKKVTKTSADPLFNFMEKGEALLSFQPLGDYLEPSYLSAIDTDLVPDGPGRSLGSSTNPWEEIHVSGNTIYVGGKALSLVDGELALDSIKVVSQATVFDEIENHTDVAGSKAHTETLHDWDFIKSNTVDTLPTAQDLNSFITDHGSSTDHDSRYYTKAEVDGGTSSVFSRYAVISDLLSGEQGVDWSCLNNIPELANLEFRGTVDSYTDLPDGSNSVIEGQVFFVKNNPDNSRLAGAYVVVNTLATDRDFRYRPLFNPSEFTHGSMSGLESDDHPQYYNQGRLSSYLNSTTFFTQTKAGLGISSVGSGQIITGQERHHLSLAYAHSNKGNNPHGVTANQIGALRDAPSGVRENNIAFGRGSGMVDTDSIPEGDLNLWATAQLYQDVENALQYAQDFLLSFDSVAQKEDLTNGEGTNLHYHPDDRDLTKATGSLSVTKVSGLQSAVLGMPEIQSLILEKHEKSHKLEDHDTWVTGDQLNLLYGSHANLKSAHNADFSAEGGDNGVSRRVARQDHTHSNLVSRSLFHGLSDSGGNSNQKVHWSNLVGIPETVGDSRVLADAGELALATPVAKGEQVVVSDYDESGAWGVYIGVGTNQGDWSLISSENAGLSYAAVNHNHDSEYVKLGDTATVDGFISDFFLSTHTDLNIPSDADQAKWNGTWASYQYHENSSKHVAPSERTDWDSAFAHSNNSNLHLSAEEKSKVSDFENTVINSTISSNATSKTLQQWIEQFSVEQAVALVDLSDWPSTVNATASGLMDLFDGTTVSGFHTHSEHAMVSHTHNAQHDLTNLDPAVGALLYLKEAGVVDLFTSKTVTTTHVSEGANKYLTEANLLAINLFSSLVSHMGDQNTNERHLTDGQKNVLTGGPFVSTDLHNHEGLHYSTDPDITIGRQKATVGGTQLIGEGGLVKAKRLASTEPVPSSSSDPGTKGEIRSDNDHIYIKCPDDVWRRCALVDF